MKPCPADPESHADAPITKPALGMSADYGLTPTPFTADPDPLAKSQASLAYSAAGVDTGELVIRGGTHYEFSFIPNPAFGGTLRGIDQVAWYTTAWFDKYVKRDSSADKRLLTTRWHNDAAEAAIDPDRDGNLFSVLLPLAPRHPARERRALQVRGHPRRLRRAVVERRLERQLLVPRRRELAGPVGRARATPGSASAARLRAEGSGRCGSVICPGGSAGACTCRSFRAS